MRGSQGEGNLPHFQGAGNYSPDSRGGNYPQDSRGGDYPQCSRRVITPEIMGGGVDYPQDSRAVITPEILWGGGYTPNHSPSLRHCTFFIFQDQERREKKINVTRLPPTGLVVKKANYIYSFIKRDLSTTRSRISQKYSRKPQKFNSLNLSRFQ